MATRAVLVVSCWLWPLAVHAATLNVSTSGVDGPGCGATASPCRSIRGAAIAAVAGDRIVVHPGEYSDDVDGDGIAGEPGEEVFALGFARDVRVESTDGAAATLITRRQAGGSEMIALQEDGVRFGALNKGFTVRGQGVTAGTVLSVTSSTGVTVAGNVFTGPATIYVGVVGAATLRDNRVLCASSASGLGVLVLSGSDTTLDRNLVQGCNQAFSVAGSGLKLTRNLALASGAAGFTLGTFAEFTRNAATGNAGPGVVFGSGSTPGLFTLNTIMGNGTFNGTNCGVQNEISGLQGTVTATGNYWGAVTGPGPDPADQVCNTAFGAVQTTPVATKDFTQLQAPLR